MKNSVAKNYIYNLIYQIFMIVSPLIVTPYISRVLTAEGVGSYSFCYSVITYFTLVASLGFGYYAQREIARFQGNKKSQSKVFFEIFLIRLLPVAISTLLHLSLVFSGVYGEKTSLFLILSINIVAVAFDVSFVLKGVEEFKKLTIRSVIVQLISICCMFAFVKTSEHVWLYTLIHALATLFSHLSLWVYLPKIVQKVAFNELKILRHLKPTLILFLPTIATSIYTSLDKTMIGLITSSDVENGNYEQAEKVVKLLLTIITSLGTVMIPRNSNRFMEGDIDAVRKNIYFSCKFVFFLGIPIMFGIICVSNNMVPWFFGDAGYTKVATIMNILSPLMLIIGLSNVFGLQFLVPSGSDKKFAIAILLGAITNFAINIFAIFLWQSIGASIATIVAECVITLVMSLFLRKQIDFTKIAKNAKNYMVAGVIMFVPTFLLSLTLTSSILNTLLIVVCGVVIYFACLTILQDEFIKIAFEKIKRNKKI